jgi:hypothetical protein
MSYYNQKYDYTAETLSAQDETNMFLKKYQAQAELSKHKMYARMPKFHMGRMQDYDPYSPTTTIEFEREPMVEMYIPQDKFRDLVERDRWIGRLEGEAEYYRKRYMQEMEDDKIRHRNPAVMKAWQQYQMLLELVR